MPDFIDLTVRVRKEKLGDMVTDMPSYCQPIRWSVVKEINVEPPKTLPPWAAKIVDEPKPKKSKIRRRWRKVPENIMNEARALYKEGMKVKDIATKLNITPSSVYHGINGK